MLFKANESNYLRLRLPRVDFRRIILKLFAVEAIDTRDLREKRLSLSIFEGLFPPIIEVF